MAMTSLVRCATRATASLPSRQVAASRYIGVPLQPGANRLSFRSEATDGVLSEAVETMVFLPSEPVALRVGVANGPWIADPSRGGELLIEAYAMAAVNLREAARAVFSSGPGIEGNIAKLFGAEHAQRVAELALRIAGPAILIGADGSPAVSDDPLGRKAAGTVVHDYLFSRCLTIAGGTSEVLRNLIAERILGLPRDPVPTAK